MRYFVKLDRKGIPVPNSLVFATKKPNSGRWMEIYKMCKDEECRCIPEETPKGYYQKVKYYYTTDEYCTPIPGSNISAYCLPQPGNFYEFYPPCLVNPCDQPTTTSTTTTSTSTTTSSTTTTTTTVLPESCCLNELITIPYAGQSFTVGGVNIGVSSTNAGNLSVFDSRLIYPACLPAYVVPPTLSMGNGQYYGILNADFTLTFSVPVNNVKIRIANYSSFYVNSPWYDSNYPYPHLRYQEAITVYANGAPATITKCWACNEIINNNVLTCAIDIINENVNGSGIFIISRDTPFTTLKFEGTINGINPDGISIGIGPWELCDFSI